MNTTQIQNSTATAGGHTPTRPELTFDGIGINGPDQYRMRVATFNGEANAQKYGLLLSQAPAMLEALKMMIDHTTPALRHLCWLEARGNFKYSKKLDELQTELRGAVSTSRAILAAVEGSAR